MQLMHSVYSIDCVISNRCFVLFALFLSQAFPRERSLEIGNRKPEPDDMSVAIYHGLGICIDLLTIRQPCTTKSNTIGWNSKAVPWAVMPHGRSSSTQPWETQYAISETIESVVGIGVPSKYFDLPLLSLGRTATVTLNRANRVNPHRTKKVRNR